MAPANGRRYHSIGSGSGASSGVARTIGVTIATATAAPASSQPRDRDPRPSPQRTAPASIASPMTLRMSTLSSVLYGVAAADQPGLQAEQEREPEDLPAAATRERRGFGVGAALAEPRARGEHQRDAREKQEERRGDAPCQGNPAVDGLRLVVEPGPRVDGVALDHDDHRRARAASPDIPSGWTRTDVGCHARMSNEVTKSMS